MLWSAESLEDDGHTVSGVQIVEVYDTRGRVQSPRSVEVRFRLWWWHEFESAAREAGFRVLELTGDYRGAPFDPGQSPFMIMELETEAARPAGLSASRLPSGG